MKYLRPLPLFLCKKEVSRKRIRNGKQNDGTFKEVQEDEVLFKRIEEDPVTVAIASATLSQATVRNVNMLSKKLSQAESDSNKLKEEVINLKAEIHKRRKVDDETTLLRTTILDQHAKLYDVRMECFDKVKMIEKHLDIVSQTHQKMRDLQGKIIELDEWRSTKRDIPNMYLGILYMYLSHLRDGPKLLFSYILLIS